MPTQSAFQGNAFEGDFFQAIAAVLAKLALATTIDREFLLAAIIADMWPICELATPIERSINLFAPIAGEVKTYTFDATIDRKIRLSTPISN